ncbi:hypothetical protein EIP75_00145 [Aquabacterium soli]|uniref:PNPLA domain-containing protein n=1 Tax=Aquabacterium soli TaxID=2493092 RepID=A0A426VGL6_9BURK|nr:patatin-like phospholipase family protein [Aquabacterium soli]RRS06057.1 hypothetical protein EIP75_00145 [Aquabacterium soli]
MAIRVVVMFGGGGALGAFGCGVWRALSRRLQGSKFVGAGGTSIGAINAAIAVKHGQDLMAGARAMETIWREALATPSLPFAGMPMHRLTQSWNGLLTGLLCGTRGLGAPNPLVWNPVMGMDRFTYPLMDRSRMWGLLSGIGDLTAATPADPLLGVGAVDVVSGQLVLFNNVDMTLGAAHLGASSAIPMLFDPVDIGGRMYWDGDVTRQAALPLLLEALRRTGRLASSANRGIQSILVTIDQMSEEAARLPSSGIEIAHRVQELMAHGKMSLPAEALAGFSHVLAIRRPPLEHDAISGQLDFSPERVDELIALGERQAIQAIDEAGLPLPATIKEPHWV